MAPTTKVLQVKVMSRVKFGSCCCAVGCSLTSGTNNLSKIKMFRFPKDEGRRRAWIAAVQRDGWLPGKSARICSTHFITGAPSVDPCHQDHVPPLFTHKTPTNVSQKLEQYQRRQSQTPVLSTDVESIDSPSLEIIHTDPKERCTAVGTDLSMADKLQNENLELKRKMASLEKNLESVEKRLHDHMFASVSDFIVNNDKHTHFYTGLPSAAVFYTLLTYLTSIWNASSTIHCKKYFCD
nr:THAP domain-containing protein 2-like [Misgurnus anguillicaudatus]